MTTIVVRYIAAPSLDLPQSFPDFLFDEIGKVFIRSWPAL